MSMIESAKKSGSKASLVMLALLVLAISSCDAGLLSQGGGSKPIALLYGVSEYIAGVVGAPNLLGPANDLNSLEPLMSGRGWETTVRKNSAATVGQLIADIAVLTATVKSGQRVLFYWSGHGLQNPANLPAGEYLGLFGTVVSGTSNLDGSAMISASQLATIFQPLISKGANLIFVLDSCYSGGFVGNRTYTNGLPDNYSTDPLKGDTVDSSTVFSRALASYLGSSSSSSSGLSSPGVWVMSAAGKDEFSYDGTLDGVTHGVFSLFFILSGTTEDGRLGGDYNQDGHVTLMESYRYCQDHLDFYRNSKFGTVQQEDYQFKAHLAGNPLDILLF